jgi:hypothetical protein
MAYSNGAFDDFSILIRKTNDQGDEEFRIDKEGEFIKFLDEYYVFLGIEEEMRAYIKQQTSMIGN